MTSDRVRRREGSSQGRAQLGADTRLPRSRPFVTGPCGSTRSQAAGGLLPAAPGTRGAAGERAALCQPHDRELSAGDAVDLQADDPDFKGLWSQQADMRLGKTSLSSWLPLGKQLARTAAVSGHRAGVPIKLVCTASDPQRSLAG